MMNHYEEQLRATVEAVEVRSYSSFRWLGQRVTATPSDLGAGTLLDRRRRLHHRLTQQLYNDFYQPGVVQPASSPSVAEPVDDPASSNFLRSLRTAHCLGTTVSWGWEPNGDRVVTRGALSLFIKMEDIVEGSNGAVGLRLRAERLGQSPGHYTVIGPVGFADECQFVRLYWNLMAEGAVPLISALTDVLVGAGVAFQFKTPRNPLDYHRCDAAVLYLDANDLSALEPHLREVHRSAIAYLREGIPALTKRIGHGVGLAEDPVDGRSFGLDRCTAISAGLIAAWERGRRNLVDRFDAIYHTFEERGIDPKTPYLNHGSGKDYAPFLDHPDLPARTGGYVSPGEALTAARSIGELLTNQAIWHGDRCNWFGQTQPGGGFAPLGPDLYAGTSGIALFLTELHQATGDRCFLDTALGAIRQALRTHDRLDGDVRLGLYSGIPGIALVSQYAGRLAGDTEIDCAGRRLLDSLDLSQPASWDLLSGAAGAALGMLIAQRLNPFSGHLVEAATQLGIALLIAGQTDKEDYLAWPPGAGGGARPLTGFAHGAAGIGHALLELGLATREPRFVEGAWKAFAYERRWYDEVQQNWPDFRHVHSKAARPRSPLPTMAGWCHGAPGIALSRLRAYQVSGDPELLHEIQAAIETTAGAIENGLATGRVGSSLCHGLTGNAEILLLASEVVPLTGENRRLIDRVARHQIQQQWRAYDWEAALSPMPGLMLGLAGRGRFLLRLARPDLPSILLPSPTAFGGYVQPGSPTTVS